MELKPLTRHARQGRLVAWDVETKPAYPGEPLNTVWLGGALTEDGAKVEHYATRDAMMQALLAPRFARCWLYAHNGSGFDLHFLLAYLTENRIEWTGYRVGSRTFVRVLDRDFLDSACVLHGSLANVADALGVATRKWKVPTDFYARITSCDWRAYLADDVRALWQSIHAVRETMTRIGASLRPTLAATALAFWRARYLHDTITTLDPWDSTVASYRAAYLGGRVEVIRPAMASGACYDINSSFPNAMVAAPVPCELIRVERGECRDADIVDATVDIPPSERFPLIPMVAPDRRLWWVTGKRRQWITGDEARECRRLYGKRAVTIHEAHVFRRRDLFSSYVRDVYAFKSDADARLAYVGKALLNHLYGKFGQRRDREKLVCGAEYLDWPSDGEKRRLEALGVNPHKTTLDIDSFLFALPDYDTHSAHIMPQVAATITARARIHLAALLRQAGERACYCDTDSVHVDGAAPDFEALCGKGLGKLKREFGPGARAEYAAPKVYWIDTGKVKIGKAKGLRRASAEQVQAYTRGEVIEVRRVMGLAESMRRRGEYGLQCETQERTMGPVTPRRRPDGSCFTTEEIG